MNFVRVAAASRCFAIAYRVEVHRLSGIADGPAMGRLSAIVEVGCTEHRSLRRVGSLTSILSILPNCWVFNGVLSSQMPLLP